MRNTNPLVSVVIPAFNAGTYINEAIESILKQSYKNLELIIVDDCSTDDTWSIIQKIKKKHNRIRAFRNKSNRKLSHTLNKGIRESRGAYIARMDADDIALPERIAMQVAYMEKHVSVGILGGSMELFTNEKKSLGYRTYPHTDGEVRSAIFRFSPFSHPLILIRSSVLNKSGLYNPRFNPAEDYELYFRIGNHSKFANLNQVLLRYRVVDNSMTTGFTRNMEMKTMDIRRMYWRDSHYHPTLIDFLYNLLQYLSVFISPSWLRLWIFNKVRNTHTL